jgi:hypothetical protein
MHHYFCISIGNDRYSLGLSKRAEAYEKMNKLGLALEDYKIIYDINYDFSLPSAKTFELKKNKDSSLKYYLIYSNHYPQDRLVKRKIDSLKSHK